MTVVINEFEVLPPDPHSGNQSGPGDQQSGAPAQTSEHEVGRIIEQLRERRERVRAD